MSKYVTPPTIPPELSGMIDPDAGFLCMTSHWRPNPEHPNPEMPGQKLSMISFIPALPTQTCLCGSRKLYRDCCSRQRQWHPICPDPGMGGYSLVAPQSATFCQVDGRAIRERLSADARLRCTVDSLESSFWVLWGDPPVRDQYGILCFGDIELKQNHTLLVTAMSDVRMRILLDLLQEIAGDYLGQPRMSRDPVLTIDKSTRKMTPQPSKRKPRRRRRKR